jgi:hypothetical protein
MSGLRQGFLVFLLRIFTTYYKRFNWSPQVLWMECREQEVEKLSPTIVPNVSKMSAPPIAAE